jgi:uncharacterized protein (TIGR00251 family)
MESNMPWLTDNQDHLILNLRVVPRAAKDEIMGLMGDALKVRIQAPPVDGKANTHLIKFLAKEWRIPRSAFEICSGETGRNKRLRIDRPSRELKARLLTIGEA